MSSAQEKYLAKVLPWPLDGAGGFINIHTPSKSHAGWGGQAFRSLPEAVTFIEASARDPNNNGVYVCQSLQSAAKEYTDLGGSKHYNAVRLSDNALFFKSLFMDADLKDYSSDEALNFALNDFFEKFLPPSVVVFTGGGYHVYWTFSETITPAEWDPLAKSLVEATFTLGLKCDTQVIIDRARVLRVPDTTNFKRGKRVELKELSDKDYSVEEIRQALLPYPVTARVLHTNGHDVDPLFPQKPPVTNDLAAGLDRLKPSLQELAAVCPFVKHTVDTHGADNLNPLWFETANIAVFLEEGRDAIHAMSDGYATYTQEETDNVFDRVTRTQREKDLGWPLCDTIRGHGSKQCDSCPHLKHHRSPFHALRQPVSQPAPSSPTGAQIVSVLPRGYERNPRGCIVKKATEGKEQFIICNKPIRDGWLQRSSEGWALYFEVDTEPEKTDQIHLPTAIVGSQNELRKELGRQGVTLFSNQVKPMGDFLVAWIQTLQETKNAVVNTSPFGWNTTNGKLEGFVFANKLFTASGIKVAQPPDFVTARSYTPSGEIQPWIDAAKLITNQNRPALNAILASSFAAPLVKFTSMRGLMMSCIGESGIGKSTALDIALAVWGHPVRAKNLLHDTDNSVMNKVGELRSLPIYWDDLQPDDTSRYARMVFQMSYGKEKDRLGANSKRKLSGDWQTIMISTSNVSLLDHVTKHGYQTTTAGVYRIFEIEVAKSDGTGQIAKSHAANLVGKLDDNYGRVGESYAEYLGKNYLAIEQEVHDYQVALDEGVNAQNPERNWTGVVACVCVGARIANRLGFTEIDEDSLRVFLLKTLEDMRAELKNQAVDMTQSDNLSAVLSSFLNAYKARNTLLTNFIHKGAGRPRAGLIKVVHNPRLEAVIIHMGTEDNLMRISKRELVDWLRNKEYPPHAFIKQLKEQFGARELTGFIGSGTEFCVKMNAFLLEMDLKDFKDIDPKELFEENQLPEPVTDK